MRKLRLREAKGLSQLASSSDREQVSRNSVFGSFLTLFKNKPMERWTDEPSLAQARIGEALEQLQNEEQPPFQQHGRKGAVTDLKAILSLKLW